MFSLGQIHGDQGKSLPNDSDRGADPLARREKFAVSLRKNKKQQLVQEKRKKLSHARPE